MIDCHIPLCDAFFVAPDGTLVSTETLKTLGEVPTECLVSPIAIDHDGGRIYALANNTIVAFDVKGGNSDKLIRVPKDAEGIVFSPHGLAYCTGNSVCVTSINNNIAEPFALPEKPQCILALTAAGRCVVKVEGDAICVFESGRTPHRIELARGSTAFAVSAFRIVFSTPRGPARLDLVCPWDAMKPVHVTCLPECWGWSAEAALDVAVDETGTVRIFCIDNGAVFEWGSAEISDFCPCAPSLPVSIIARSGVWVFHEGIHGVYERLARIQFADTASCASPNSRDDESPVNEC